VNLSDVSPIASGVPEIGIYKKLIFLLLFFNRLKNVILIKNGNMTFETGFKSSFLRTK
jgi:hypothetical protein